MLTVVFRASCFSGLDMLIPTFAPNEDPFPAVINLASFPLPSIPGTFGAMDSASGIAELRTSFQFAI